MEDAAHIAYGSARGAQGSGVLVLGIGNMIMSDDGIGPALATRLSRVPAEGAAAIDGGTCGLALLPHIEAAHALIVVDAARLGRAPGVVSIFEGAAMDAVLCGAKTTAHEVALADLLDAAQAIGARPARRALVAVEPCEIRVGTIFSPAVAQGLDWAEVEVRALVSRWRA